MVEELVGCLHIVLVSRGCGTFLPRRFPFPSGDLSFPLEVIELTGEDNSCRVGRGLVGELVEEGEGSRVTYNVLSWLVVGKGRVALWWFGGVCSQARVCRVCPGGVGVEAVVQLVEEPVEVSVLSSRVRRHHPLPSWILEKQGSRVYFPY